MTQCESPTTQNHVKSGGRFNPLLYDMNQPLHNCAETKFTSDTEHMYLGSRTLGSREKLRSQGSPSRGRDFEDLLRLDQKFGTTIQQISDCNKGIVNADFQHQHNSSLADALLT